MKNKIFNNFGYKILAVFFAILLWLIVINITDYSVSVTIEDIPVEQINTDVLDELDQVYDVVKGGTVDIVVKGRRSVVNDLKADDFYAYADLSQMSITNSVQINVEPKRRSLADEITITCSDNMIQLSLEDKVSEQFPVRVVTDGTTMSGYAVGDAYATPNIITIEGPKSAVDKITDVVVTVSVRNASEDLMAVGDIVLLDAYGEEIINDKIVLSQESADANVIIYPIKTIDVNVEIKGTVMDGYAVSEVVYQPKTIDVAGLDEDLEKIDEINIDNISVSGMYESLQTTVNINDYLPDGIILAQQLADIAITVDIEKVTSKEISITADDITLTDKKSGYEYEVELSNDFKVEISGLENVITDMTVTDIIPVINCADLDLGANTVRIDFKDIDDIKYDVSGNVTVNVISNDE
ncbi:MAG: hypothetical protein IJ053_06040 [Lachnospiraceae bacterium]|nr:hypothetical protein [Lachnospiraceae bacterium]